MAAEPTAEERELTALLTVSLDGLDTLGLGDPAFDPPAPPARPAAPPKPQAPAQASVPAEPFNRSLGRMGDRNPVYKSNLLKDYQAAVDQMREAYDLICLADMPSLAPVRNTAALLQEMFRKDPHAVLALSVTRGSSSGEYLYRHAVNVGMLTMAAATAAGFSKAGVLEAGTAGLIADVGMRLVPDAILNKTGKLTEEELDEIHRHTAYSATLLSALEGVSQPVLNVAQQHHERLTGGGYPERKSGAQIAPEARMVGIADTLAAMLHKRSHRDALSPQEGLERVVKMAQMNFLDWEILKGLVGYLAVYPVGSAVELSGGRVARVVEAHPEEPARPVVAVLKDATGPLALKAIYRLDLKTTRDEKILKCQDPEAMGYKPLDGF